MKNCYKNGKIKSNNKDLITEKLNSIYQMILAEYIIYSSCIFFIYSYIYKYIYIYIDIDI